MRKEWLQSKGLHFTEQELELSAISPLPAELYVREKLDEEWISNLQALLREGLLEPQIVVGKVQNLSGLHIVEGHHTYHALLREGIKTTKALVLTEELDYITLAGLQIALNAVVQKPLTVKEKKALLLRLYLKYKQELGKDFWRQRAQIIQRLIEETEIPRRTVYYLLETELSQEKEELRKSALELHKAGKPLSEISQMLGVPKPTLFIWIKDLSEPHSTSSDLCQIAQIRRSHLIIFLNKDTLNPAFMELLSKALEEGKKVEEFFKEKEGLFKKEEVEEFKSRLRRFLEKVVLKTYTLSDLRKKGFAELVKSKLALSVKACFALYEESKPIYEEVEKAVKELEPLVEVVCQDNEVKNEEDARKALKEKLKEQEFALEYFDELYAGIKDKVKECLSKYPVLTVKQVFSHYSVKDLEGLSEEELREELLASFPTYKVPSSVVEDVYDEIRLPALLKEFEEGGYASVSEYEEKLVERDKRVVLKFNDLFVDVLNKKKKGGEEDHKRWARKMQEEGLDTETARKRAWQEEGIIITTGGLQAYKTSVQAEVKQEPTPSNSEEQEEDISIEECAVRVGTKGFYRFIQTLIKQVKEIETLIEQGKTDKALKTLSKVSTKLNAKKEELEKKIEKQSKTLNHSNKVLYNLLKHMHDFSVKAFDLPIVFEGEEGKLLKILDKAVGRYEEVLEQKGISKSLEKNFDEFLPVFLETYAYAFLKVRPPVGKFLANFINYRHEFSHTVREQNTFITLTKEKKTYQDIVELVRRYLGGVKDGA